MNITLYIDPRGPITVRDDDGITSMYAPGEWVGGEWVDTVIADLPKCARKAARELWKPDVVSEWRDLTQMPEPSTADIVEEYRQAVQGHVDAIAKTRRYDNGYALASYTASTNPVWAAEAQAFVAWRDAVWAHAYTELDKVTSGQREQPGVAEFIGELPVITWPG